MYQWLEDDSLDAFKQILQIHNPNLITQSVLYLYATNPDVIEPINTPSYQIVGGTCTKHWRLLYFDGSKIHVYDSMPHYTNY